MTMIGAVPLLLPGAHGSNLVQASLTFDVSGVLTGRRSRPWELKQLTGSDGRLDELVREFEAAHGLVP